MWLLSSAIASARPSSSAASSSSMGSSGDTPLPLERRLIRVDKADISRVTAEDIQRVRANLTNDALAASLQVLVETNRFADVLASASPSAWAEAAAGVTEVQRGLCGSLMRDRMILLYNILPFVSDKFLAAMGESYMAGQ
ncbi:hypothetical protein JKF63_07295 [Porcisia hertigi]|uniref:Uncharacterized protein n=1 Tax=Porcisia hertigi TaxID=2761500 RepID=A0A836YHV0_9TRYP|nr:hypothetical protein JKF63_07295 [Porcisia hertigi]